VIVPVGVGFPLPPLTDTFTPTASAVVTDELYGVTVTVGVAVVTAAVTLIVFDPMALV
jgi:hypothetical protein